MQQYVSDVPCSYHVSKENVSFDATPQKCMPPPSQHSLICTVCTQMTLTVDLWPWNLISSSPKYSKCLCKLWFKSIQQFRSCRLHKILMAVTVWPWSLITWPWKSSQQCKLTWLVFVLCFIEIPPLSKEIWHQINFVNWSGHDLDLWPWKRFSSDNSQYEYPCQVSLKFLHWLQKYRTMQHSC